MYTVYRQKIIIISWKFIFLYQKDSFGFHENQIGQKVSQLNIVVTHISIYDEYLYEALGTCLSLK